MSPLTKLIRTVSRGSLLAGRRWCRQWSGWVVYTDWLVYESVSVSPCRTAFLDIALILFLSSAVTWQACAATAHVSLLITKRRCS